jgi:hypothetical protein
MAQCRADSIRRGKLLMVAARRYNTLGSIRFPMTGGHLVWQDDASAGL